MQVRKLLMIGALSLMLAPGLGIRRRAGSSLRLSAATSAATPTSATSRMTMTKSSGAWTSAPRSAGTRSVVGFEIDLGYSPNFFEDTAGDRNFEFGDSNVTTLMGNVLLSAASGQRLPSVLLGRPRPDPREREQRHGSVQRPVDQ